MAISLVQLHSYNMTFRLLEKTNTVKTLKQISGTQNGKL